MPNLGELGGRLVGLVGNVLGNSALRLGAGPTLAVLVVLLVLLSMIARPASRWRPRDLGGLSGARRAMALAAESGAPAAFSLGTAGLVRGAGAVQRLQTLAGLTILADVAHDAARSGVALTVSSNDPVATVLAAAVLEQAHLRIASEEHAGRSRAIYLGEGRAAAAGLALAAGTPVEASPRGPAFAAGGFSEESLLLLGGMASGASTTAFGTAEPAQAPSVLLEGEGTLIGAQLYQAPSELEAGTDARLAVLAANRLIWLAVAVLVIGTGLILLWATDLRTVLGGLA